jgi:hypothetical protein
VRAARDVHARGTAEQHERRRVASMITMRRTPLQVPLARRARRPRRGAPSGAPHNRTSPPPMQATSARSGSARRRRRPTRGRRAARHRRATRLETSSTQRTAGDAADSQALRRISASRDGCRYRYNQTRAAQLNATGAPA